MPHGTTPNQNVGMDWVLKRKNAITFCSQVHFVWIKASFVDYNSKELYKKLDLKKYICMCMLKGAQNGQCWKS